MEYHQSKNELSKDVNDYVIIFRDRSKMFINKRVYDFILEESFKPNADKARIGDKIVSIRDMSKILSIEEFYSQYPKERPDTVERFTDKTPYSWKKEKGTKNLEAMMRGLKKYIESTKDSPLDRHSCQCGCGSTVHTETKENPKNTYKLMEERLNQLNTV